MKHYILSTVSEAIRLLQNLPRGVPLTETLKFRDVSRIWGAPGAKWSVFSLVSFFISDGLLQEFKRIIPAI